MVWWHGKEVGVPWEEAAAQVDTIVTGPHAGTAIPVELRSWVSPSLTRRQQYDYSDVATGPVGRAWAARDPGVVFVQNCVSRVATDANRAAEDDPEPGLRAFFQRWREGQTSFGGVDSVRPITFNHALVLAEPGSDTDWAALSGAIRAARARGPWAYYGALEAVVDAVVARCTFTDAAPLSLICLHDTDNRKCAPDGSLSEPRPHREAMPALACLGNGGDPTGDGDALTMPRAELLRLAAAWAEAFGHGGGAAEPCGCNRRAAPCACAISLNRPYGGGFEAAHWAGRIRAKGAAVHAVQAEFLRPVLHGP
eukprot:7340902-Prymnesium_polylepis.1